VKFGRPLRVGRINEVRETRYAFRVLISKPLAKRPFRKETGGKLKMSFRAVGLEGERWMVVVACNDPL
jgi:hypothetical protein